MNFCVFLLHISSLILLFLAAFPFGGNTIPIVKVHLRDTLGGVKDIQVRLLYDEAMLLY